MDFTSSVRKEDAKALHEYSKTLPKIMDDNGGFLLDADLERKMDQLSKSVIRKWAPRLYEAIDTSEVGYFRLVGECIVDDQGWNKRHYQTPPQIIAIH